jgi:hypothetical protein
MVSERNIGVVAVNTMLTTDRSAAYSDVLDR